MIHSKNYPTYHWNIPKRPPTRSLCLGIPESFGDEFGDSWGMRLSGYVGVLLDPSIPRPSMGLVYLPT